MAGRRVIQIGTVIKPHGVRGELSVDCHVESPLLFDTLGELLLGDDQGRLKPYALVRWREHQGRALLILGGVADRDAAEALRGLGVFIPKDLLPPLEDDEVYLDDLVGLTILLPDGQTLGRLADIQTPGGQELWIIETPDGKEVLFPANEDNAELDLDAGQATIHPPPGLLELYLGE